MSAKISNCPPWGPFAYATSICRDLATSAPAYQQLLGYRASNDHRPCPNSRCLLLFPPHESIGGIHLLERISAAAARPWQVSGGAALEIVIRDADDVAAHAAAVVGFDVIGGPRPAGRNRRLRVVHVRGPDGEVLYLTRILPAERPHRLPDRPQGLIGRVYSTVIAVADIDHVRDRLMRRLGGNLISDRRAALATAALVRGDPTGCEYRLSSMSIAGGSIVELDEIPGVAPAPAEVLAGPVTAQLLGPAPAPLQLDLSDVTRAWEVDQ